MEQLYHDLFLSTLIALQSSPGMETHTPRKGRTNTQKGTARLSLEDASMPRECLLLLAGKAGKKFWAQNKLGEVETKLGEVLEQIRKGWDSLSTTGDL